MAYVLEIPWSRFICLAHPEGVSESEAVFIFRVHLNNAYVSEQNV